MLNRQEPYGRQSFYEYFITQYAGVPYGAMPLSKVGGYKEGMTLLNFETMDCVTFLENYIASALTYKKIIEDYKTYTNSEKLAMFVRNLDAIRYYQGANCTWNDRIYYFTHALEVMKDQKMLKSIGTIAGVPFRKKINYVSTNRSKFAGITDWKRIIALEKRMSEANVYYFPLDKIDHYQPLAHSGDLVALATDVKGLDVSHCGFIHVFERDLYFSHASSTQKKVVYKEDFRHYLSKRTSITGIFVYRPLF